MAIDEVRVRLRRKLEETFGVDEASILMDRPPGGWSDLVTKDELHRALAAQDERFDLKLGMLEHQLTGVMDRGFRDQTWRLVTVLIAGMGTMIGALVAVARF